jgi:hypothetical protein
MLTKGNLLDKRVVRRALEKGLMNKAQFQKALEELPDVSHKVQQKSAAPLIESQVSAADTSYDDLDDEDDEDDDDDTEETDDAAP